jgi:flagellar biosynthesis/type III secretory pathway M-ring protein FliF/YscJ
VNLELLAALLAGGSLIVSLAVLVLVWRVLRNARRSRAASDERLEILREQQERLKIMGQERSMLKEELERLRSVLEEVEEERQLELTAPAEPEQPERRSWWRRLFEG